MGLGVGTMEASAMINEVRSVGTKPARSPRSPVIYSAASALLISHNLLVLSVSNYRWQEIVGAGRN